MWRATHWRPPTRFELMARFGLREEAGIIVDIVEPFPRGRRHQPRVRAGTRVRVLEAFPGEPGAGPLYRVELCDPRGRPSGYWALVPEANLTEIDDLGVVDWLLSLLR